MAHSIRHWSRSLSVAMATVTLFSLMGCGEPGPKTVEVKGTVSVNGTPIKLGTIMFVPDQAGATAYGEINPEGQYVAKVAPGTYKVAINAVGHPNGPEGPVVNYAPEKYSTEQTSGLTATVPEEGETTIDFDLEGPQPKAKK